MRRRGSRSIGDLHEALTGLLAHVRAGASGLRLLRLARELNRP
jgi:hypothetical protein